MKHMFICASLAALATGCAPMDAGTAGDAPAGDVAADATPTAAPEYIAMAGSSDLYEIESSRLALERAQSPAVRRFAQMMIDHHTMTTQQVMQAAQAAGMSPPPPMLLPPQRAMLDELQPANGADFERIYVRQQRMAHRMALALHGNYAQNGDTAQLRQAASGAVPIIQRHIDELRSL
jgi:putative membrane protein